MDSHDSPRSIIPARSYSVPQPMGGANWSSQAPAATASPSPQLFKIVFRALRRYWWLVLGLWGVLAPAACAVVYLKVQPLYESQSYLRVEDKRTIFDQTAPTDLDVFLETLVQLVQSNNVLSAAALDPNVQNLPRIRDSGDAVQELRKMIYVQKVPKTYLISVAMVSKDPEEAAIVVNAVVSSFIKQNRLWTSELSAEQKTTLTNILSNLEARSKDLRDEWMALVKKGDVDSQVFNEAASKAGGNAEGGKKGTEAPSSHALITIEQFRRNEEKYRDVQIELAAAEAELNHLTHRKPVADPQEKDEAEIKAQVEQLFMMEPETSSLRDKFFELDERIKKIRKIGTVFRDPAEDKIREQFAQTKRRYDELWAVREPIIRHQLTVKKNIDPQEEIRDAEAKVSALKGRLTLIENQTKNLKMASAAMASDQVEIAMIREERDSIKLMRDTVQRKLDDLEYTSKDGSRIRLSNEAVPARKPTSNSRLKYMAMMPVGVLGVVLCLVIALELRSARVYDPDSLSVRMHHEVFPIAPLPNIRGGEDARSLRSEQKLARFVQSLDHLRVALCEGGVPGQGRCVLITSATGGEGKTTLSAHLAARCANAGTSTILIDADMRRASLGRLLDVVSGPGLADVLNGDISLADALRPVQTGGFAFLSAGTTDIDPSRILTPARVSALIEQLRGTYDLVLIDSPPILPVPDALLLGRHVDGVVMASRFDASRLPLVERANRQLAAAGIPVLGMVVNGARGHASAYDNYHYNYPNPASRRDEEPV